jgi:hypothetical protein
MKKIEDNNTLVFIVELKADKLDQLEASWSTKLPNRPAEWGGHPEFYKKETIRLPPTAPSRRQSRGLHPVGALSVPPLESFKLGEKKLWLIRVKTVKGNNP